MNTKELKEQVSSLPSELIFKKVMVNKDSVLELIDQLDEPQRVVIPKLVAEYIKEYKEENQNIYNLLTEYPPEIGSWLNDNYKERLDTLARAWLDGYEIEQEKLYTVEIPDPNNVLEYETILARNMNGLIEIRQVEKGGWSKEARAVRLTESEIKKDFEWAWQWAEPVEEER